MNEEDKLLLEIYMLGFSNELMGKTPSLKLLIRAYTLGVVDAYIGDDVSSIDKQTNEEILKRIKKEGKL